MRMLYNLLLKSKYSLKYYYNEKSFTFYEEHGDWSKQFTVSKYGQNYIVDGFEGTKDFIKTFKIELKKYKDVIKYLEI